MAALRKTSDLYLIALGSNKRHHRHGPPEAVLGAAVAALRAQGLDVEAVAPVIRSAPVGPSRRRYANGAVVVRCDLAPPAMLALVKRIEADFGRRRGQRWGARVVDLDLVLWSGGVWRSKGLEVPHRLWRLRDFVMRPACAIAPRWRDPVTGFSVAQHFNRLTKPRPAPRGALP